MTLNQAQQTLQEITSQIQQWIEQGYTPTIQKQTTLTKLANVYEALAENSVPAHTKQAPVIAPTLMPAAVAVQIQPNAMIEPDAIITQSTDAPRILSKTDPEQSGLHTIVPQPLKKEGMQLFGAIITCESYQMFIDELFWRDQAFFDNEIRKFNEMSSLDEALIYIGEKYNWAPGNRFAIQFIDLLENYYN